VIPGIVITLVTFPGFVMSTVSRRFCCDLLGVPVYEIHYFKGTIRHGRIESAGGAALAAFAPFFVNTVLCSVLFFPVGFSLLLSTNPPGQEAFVELVLAWAGLSIGMHAFPSSQSIEYYLERLPQYAHRGPSYLFLRIMGKVFILVKILKFFWFDLLYALAVGIVAPYLVTRALMVM